MCFGKAEGHRRLHRVILVSRVMEADCRTEHRRKQLLACPASQKKAGHQEAAAEGDVNSRQIRGSRA